MAIPVEVIKFIYFHDETLDEGDCFIKSVATKNYTKALNEFLILTKDNPILNKNFLN